MTFHPTLLGTTFVFHEEDCDAMITDENDCAVFIESDFFTGWMSKADFYESLGHHD